MFRVARLFCNLLALATAFSLIVFLSGCTGLVSGTGQPPGGTPGELTVVSSGSGTGTVTSSPAGINCTVAGFGSNSGTCIATFNGSVTLTAAPNQGFTFTSWSGCTSSNATTCTVSGAATVTATFAATLQSINHIIFISQENRSFDEYFGAMRQYWAQNGIPDQPFDGLAQFNPPADPSAAPTNPGCDPADPFPPSTWCFIDSSSPPVPSFHYPSTCVENPSPSWSEAHRAWNSADPTSETPLLNGFVQAGANVGRQYVNTQGVYAPYFDSNGYRVMGYYDGTDLNYYYSLASMFSTSDRWFSPVMTRTPPNREFLIAATSHGYVYQRGANPPLDTALIPSTTIFEALQNAGISWKIYINPKGTPCETRPTDVACLVGRSYIHDFVFGNNIKNNPGAYAQNIVPISQFYTDAVNGTLPQVAQIEPDSSAALDEHPEDDDPPAGQPPCCSIQPGANFVSTLINAVMCGQNNSPPSGSCNPGPSWADSVFILTFDEAGGFYDHVAPQKTVNPDGIQPVDLKPNDACYGAETPNTICDFAYTGYRVPLVVVSPYAKKNFVSHDVRDATAILKLIETRFNLSPLTARDAAQIPMDDPNSGFFDFNNMPWKTPPSNLPVQNRYPASACFISPAPAPPPQ